MRGGGEFSGESLAGIMKHLVSSTLPEKASCHVVDLAVTGDVRRPAVLTVIPREFFRREASHTKDSPDRMTVRGICPRRLPS
jgi:hypothetical protein